MKEGVVMNTLLHEIGKKGKKTIVMIHGTAMSWDMFLGSAGKLAKDYRVILVSVPGHDPRTSKSFTSIEQIADDIEMALIKQGYTTLDMVYGLSMGGGLVIRMLADDRLVIRHAIIDAGITPYEYPRIVTRMILLKDFLMTEWGKHSKKALSLAFPPEDYTQFGLDMMWQTLQHMSAQTIWRVYDSTDNYSMPKTFPTLNTVIEYWYGEKEEKERKTDIHYVRNHIPGILLRRLDGMKHGQYVVTKPDCFIRDIHQRMERLI